MERIESLFKVISRWRILVPMVLLVLGIEAAFSFWLMPGFIRVSGGGILDMGMAYTPGFALEFLQRLASGGLPWYNRIQFLDCFFPLVYGGTLCGFLYKIYSRKYDKFTSYLWILMIPLGGAACDLLENLFIRIMIITGEGSVGVLGWITSALSTIKFLSIGLGFLFILTGFGYFIKGKKDAFKK